jgi:ribosomal RNA assembly protein
VFRNQKNKRLENMEEIIKIPEDRIGVLIGPKGAIKAKIAKKGKCKIEVDSGSGEATIEGEGEDFFRAMDTVKAIARGFSPERALKLFEHDYLLKVIDITDYTGKNASTQKAKRGRVIGRNGLARTEIEKKTNAMISVYGKTVSIIALPDEMEKAIEAVDMLLSGAKHETMERFLEEKGKDIFQL